MSNLPPLPVPWDHCYIWNGPYGARKFTIAPHNGRPCDKAVLIFTEDQLKAFAEEAVRLEREQCAQACEDRAAAYRRTQAPGWHEVDHECTQCAYAIRAQGEKNG